MKVELEPLVDEVKGTLRIHCLRVIAIDDYGFTQLGVLIQILYLLVYDTLITAVCAMNDDSDIDGSLNFNGAIVGNKPVFKFTCESFQRPIGDAISFQVNLMTVDVIRHSNNKCYNRYKECRTDTCLCYYDGVKFKMEYWYEVLNISESLNFGVELILKDTNANIVAVTLSRFYNGKDFEKLEIVKETNQYKFMENTEKFGNDLESGARKEWILKVLSASVCLSLMVIFCVLCIHRSVSTCSIEKLASVPDIFEGLKTFTSYIATNEQCFSSESGYEDSESDLLTADDQPPKDKPFVLSQEYMSFGKKMQYSDNKKEIDQSIDAGGIDSEERINLTSGIEPPPVFCEYPEDETVLAKEKKNVCQSSSISFQQIDEDYDTEEVSSDFDEMESDHLFEYLVEDNNSEGHYWEFGETGCVPSEDIESEEDSSDFEEIDFELTEETVITCLIDRPSSENDESKGMQICTSYMSTSEKFIPNESAHEDKDSDINISYIDDEPAKDQYHVIFQDNKSLSKRLQYSNNVEEADQIVVARRAHSNGQIKTGPPPVFCEDYQVETLQISVFDEKGFHLSCSYEQLKGDNDDYISEYFQCLTSLVSFEDTDLEDDCYDFVEIETEYTPSITRNNGKALLVIGSTETGKSRSSESLVNLTMRGSYLKDCRSTITCKTAKERQLESNTTPNTVHGVPKINFIVNAISILGSVETQDISVPYNTLKDFDRRIELLIHSTICRSFRFHICSCVNRQDSKLGDDVLQQFFLDLKHRKSKLMLQHG
ncbi:unnamed protein product [Mytilus coruscus]|uniref:Uncharacterized protein n=1 Tax=Mytilus coruscus TaxID=42192 RepID=A0A6J8DK75_MYTCO|nr:unnamed protein product [Mytilus coruscus]